eukprot:458595_1
MARCSHWFVAVVYLLTHFTPSHAEYMEGYVNLLNDDGFSFLGHWMFGDNRGNATTDSWHFDKFKAGTLDITLTLHKALIDDTRFELAMYDDQAESWPLLLANKSNGCRQHESIYGINKDMVREWTIIKFLEDEDGNDTWSATINIHEHIKPRWWWAYLVKCDFERTPAGDYVRNDIHYKLHWQQSSTNEWNREFSLHEEYQNTFHCVTPWLTLILFVVQCVSCGMYYRKSKQHAAATSKGYVHVLIKVLTLCLFLQFIASIFSMFYWLHLTYSGYKEFGILTFSFLFEISSNVLFLYLLIALFAFGVRMSISKLNPRLNYVLIALCCACEMFHFIVYVWSYQYYPNKEETLYRYTQYPQVVYGVTMLIAGCIFYLILLFATCRDSLNGIITKIQRNFRLLVGFVLMWTWFVWPIIAVGAADTFEISRIDFGCDVVSWTMKMLSFCIVTALIHPINPYHDRCFDFGKHFVHARYVKNSGGMVMFDEDDEDDEDNDEDKAQVQMNEIKRATVFSTKFSKKKKKQKKQKLFKYNGRNQIAQDSDDESDDSDEQINVNLNAHDEEDDEDDSPSDNDEVAIGGHVHPHAVTIDD